MSMELAAGPTGTSEVTPAAAGPTALYTITQRQTNAIATMTGVATSREQAILAAVQVASTGPTGTEARIWQTAQITATTAGTGIYATSYNATAPLTGSTFVGVSREDAQNQAVAAGPTGPGAGIAIRQTTP